MPKDFLADDEEFASLIQVCLASAKGKGELQIPFGSVRSWSPSLKTALSILLNSCCPMFLVWGSDRILFYNDACSSIFNENGCSISFGQSIEDGWAAWEDIQVDIERVFDTGESFRREVERQVINCDRSSGKHSFVWSYSAVWDGAVIGGVFATGYRTAPEAATAALACEEERQQTEQELHRTNRTLETLFKASPLPLIVVEPNLTTVQLWNPAATNVFGWSEEDVLGKPIPIAPEEKLDQWRQVREAVVKGKVFLDVETYCCKYDGSKVIVSISAAPLYDDHSNCTNILLILQDVTQQKQSEAALRESEARFRRIFECEMMPMGIWTSTGAVLEANDALLNLIGYTRQELEAGEINWVGMTPPEYLPLDEYALSEIAARGSSTPYEKVYVHKNGRRIPVLIGGASFLDDSKGGVFFAIDLTERKQVESALQESTAILKAINQTSPTLIFVKDLQGRMLMANPSTIQAIGKSEAEIIGKTDVEFHINRGEAERIMENDRWVMRTGQLQIFKEIVEVASGRRTYLSTKSPYRDQQGNTIGLIGIAFDITDRKQAEAALGQSEERYRHLVELIPQLVWTADAEGVLLDVNQRWLDFTGLTLSQIRVEGWRAIVHPEDVPILYQRWTESQQNGMHYRAEGRMRRFDGLYRWHLHQAVPLKNEQGQVIKWFGTATDIEDQKQLEQQRDFILQQEQAAREEAERANRIKDEFLAVLSHELRSPLNPILGWTKLLRTHKFDQLSTERALETIERNAKLQTQLIDDLLDVSRILRGKIILNVAPVDLMMVIDAALETVRLSAEAKGIQIQKTLTTVGLVSGDSSRLQQVVWNLLSNAIKFTSPGGRVEVRLESYEVSVMNSELIDSTQNSKLKAQNSRSYAQITVSDTGKGITPEFLPYVFDYFRQEDSTTTRRFGGLGLGLAIVRYLTELHGGTVGAESAGEGLGATFKIRLPLMGSRESGVGSRHAIRNSYSEAMDAPLQGLRILVVDDEPDMRELMLMMLERAGAEVRITASAAEALQALDSFEPAVLISDIGMPEVDGYMLMQQVRARSRERGGQIPAIALTAYAGEYDQKQALAVGFQRHIPKPVEPATLIAAIAALLGRQLFSP